MAGRHPEYYIDRLTWKDLRTLYQFLAMFLEKIDQTQLQEAERTDRRLPQRGDAHRDAALESARVLENRVRSKQQLSQKEQEVWDKLQRDNNLEMLRARLRAFELYETGKTGIATVKTPCLLERDKSTLEDLHAYAVEHSQEIQEWLTYMNIEVPMISNLLSMGANLSTSEGVFTKDIYAR